MQFQRKAMLFAGAPLVNNYRYFHFLPVETMVTPCFCPVFPIPMVSSYLSLPISSLSWVLDALKYISGPTSDISLFFCNGSKKNILFTATVCTFTVNLLHTLFGTDFRRYLYTSLQPRSYSVLSVSMMSC